MKPAAQSALITNIVRGLPLSSDDAPPLTLRRDTITPRDFKTGPGRITIPAADVQHAIERGRT